MEIKTVAVIGGGAMGRQIALNTAIYPYEVYLTDNNAEVLKKVKEWEEEYLAGRIAKGRMTEEKVEGIKSRFHLVETIEEAVKNADLVIEVVVERKDVKEIVLKEISKFVKEDAIIATNSSYMVSSLFKDIVPNPSRLCNLHYFNPALVMKLTEIVKGEHTSEETIQAVYEFSKNFRNEGMDKTHNPEFTCMEIYISYKDYKWMMEFTEKMLEKICLDVNGTTEVKMGDNIISFKAPFARKTMTEAIKDFTGIDITGMDEAQLRDVCKQLHIEVDETMGKGKLIDEIFGEKCEGNYIQPTFITDYPIEMSPLCKRHRENPELTERFELMVNGKELANAYSELNDPIDQLERFQEQLRLSEKGDDEAMFIDMDFVRALEYGMPPTSGMGIGMDRLVMLMTGQTTIQEVLFFPQMKPEKQQKSQEQPQE